MANFCLENISFGKFLEKIEIFQKFTRKIEISFTRINDTPDFKPDCTEDAARNIHVLSGGYCPIYIVQGIMFGVYCPRDIVRVILYTEDAARVILSLGALRRLIFGIYCPENAEILS